MKNLTKTTLISLATLTALSMGAWAECSGDVDMGGHRITNVADPVNFKDVVTKGYMDEALPDMRDYFTEEDTVYTISRMLKKRDRFIRNNDVDSSTHAIVLDTVTGLLWADHAIVTKQWMLWDAYEACPNNLGDNQLNACRDTVGDTAMSYCENLSLGHIYSWRLPSTKELLTIRKEFSETSNYDAFSYNSEESYWTYENYPDNYFQAMAVSFDNDHPLFLGYDDHKFKDDEHAVRCVSSEYIDQ